MGQTDHGIISNETTTKNSNKKSSQLNPNCTSFRLALALGIPFHVIELNDTIDTSPTPHPLREAKERFGVK